MGAGADLKPELDEKVLKAPYRKLLRAGTALGSLAKSLQGKEVKVKKGESVDMKLYKLAVLLAFALSLGATRADENEVQIKVNDNEVKAEADLDNERKDRGGLFSKTDGKILKLFPAPSARKNKAEVDARVGDNRVDIEADADRYNSDVDIDRNVGGSANLEVDTDRNNNHFKKGDGKILGVDVDRNNDLEVESEIEVDGENNDLFKKGDGKILGVDVDRNDSLSVEGDVDLERQENGIFRKGDGKILGVDVDRDQRELDLEAEADLDVDREKDWVVEENSSSTRNKVTPDADGGLDTDKNDGRILGLPKRGFDTLSMNEVPEQVRKAIRQHARGAKVVEIELADHNGMQVYEVDVERAGRNQELHISADGRLLKNTDATGSAPGRETGTRTKIEVENDHVKIEKD